MFNIDNLVITKPILNIIAEIDEFKGTWSTLGKLAPDRLQALRHVATIESIGSSTRIEGSALSDQEVEALLANIPTASFASRDQQEVAGYAAVMETVFEAYAHIPLTENVIKQFHRDLLQYSHKDTRHRGEYKTTPNSVEAFDADGNSIGVVFQTSSPFDTPNHMTELMTWLEEQKQKGELHPLLIIAVFVVVFLEIHPFQDGNGRLSRIITTLLLLQFDYSYVPYCSMESVIEQNKDTYYLALRRTQKTIRSENPDWQPWVLFFLQSLQNHKVRLQKKIEREWIVFATLPELSQRILTFIKEHGRASVADLVRATGSNRNTLKDHVRQLVKIGQLTMHGAGRGTWYAMACERL